MLSIYAETLVNNNLLELMSERGRNRVVKLALTEGLKYFDQYILPERFTLAGQMRYKHIFKRSIRKMVSGKPSLVKTGEFRNRILESDPKIRATFRKASIVYPFGRPTSTKNSDYMNPYVADLMKTNPLDMKLQTRKNIFSFMRGKSIKFEEARKQVLTNTQTKVYKLNVYNKNVRKMMHDGIGSMNDYDRRKIVFVMNNFVVDNYKRLGKANVKVSKNV